MNIYDKIATLSRYGNITNVLFFNDFTIKKQDLEDLSKIIPNIYVSFYNYFHSRSLCVKLRSIKNIQFVDPNMIPLVNYNFISTDKITEPVLLLLSKIQSIRYVNITGQIIYKSINGFQNDSLDTNLFKRSDELIITNHSLNRESFNGDIKKLNEMEVNKNNINKSNDNKSENKEPVVIKDKNSILVKNITSTKTKFDSSPFKNDFIDGQLDVFSILENKKDYTNFINVLKFLSKNYKFSKLYVYLNGATILKYFKENDLKDFDYILVKFPEKNDIELCKKSFQIFSNGALQINFKDFDLSKNILDIINEDCISITNI